MYRRLTTGARPVDRERIAVYYRAFLFYLMVGKSGPRLVHLKPLLRAHFAHRAFTTLDEECVA
jgi:hypothetical protein